MIRVICRQCGSKLNAKEKLAGKTLPCPKCQQPVTVPALDAIEIDDAPPVAPPPVAPGVAPADASPVVQTPPSTPPVEIIHFSPEEGILVEEPAISRLDRQNRYLICDPSSVVATWKNDGRGWMFRLASGFAPAKRNRDNLPTHGKFAMVELEMRQDDAGVHLAGLCVYELAQRFALTKLALGDDDVIQAVHGFGRLARDQKNAVRMILGELFMREVWGDSTHVLDYLANADYHSPGIRQP